MKKTTTLLGLIALTSFGFAQSPRMPLWEEFTGENCPPCASTNPVIAPFLNAHQNIDMITLKWQVPIPSAPTLATSLYQQDKTEIDARAAYYAVGSAPSSVWDGQQPQTFGATSEHAYYVSESGVLDAVKAVTSPFTISMNRSYDPTYSTITVTGTITASQAYTAVGALKFRLVMTEKEIHYATAPGSNGEKDFEYIARKSFPDLANGTAMASSWTASQTQTFSIACPIPAYIWDKSQIEMVGFIQDDGNQQVLQSVLGVAAPLGIDAKAVGFTSLGDINCATTATPQAVINNQGLNAITSMTINAFRDAVAQPQFIYNGNIPAGSTATIALNAITGLTGGTHTYSINIVGVDAGDNNLANNTKKQSFVVVASYAATPIIQTYSLATFPGTGWVLLNPDGGAATTTWQRSTAAGAYGVTPANSAKYNFYNNANVGDIDELYMPAMSFAGMTAPTLKWDMAYATYSDASTSELNDGLDVKISTDCGANWATIYSNSGATMATAPTTSVAFVPTAAQWTSKTIDLTSYAGQPEVLVKFAAINDYGNNMYIDNINLSELTTSVKQLVSSIEKVELFPNPTNNETALTVSLTEESPVSVSIINNVGQTIFVNSATLNVGSNVLNIDTKQYAAGIYNVVIATKNGSVTKKLSVTK